MSSKGGFANLLALYQGWITAPWYFTFPGYQHPHCAVVLNIHDNLWIFISIFEIVPGWNIQYIWRRSQNDDNYDDEMNFKHIKEGSLKERLPTNMIIIRHQAVVHKSVMRCIYIGFTSAGRGLTRWSRGESRLIQMQEPMQPNVMQGNVWCKCKAMKCARYKYIQ